MCAKKNIGIIVIYFPECKSNHSDYEEHDIFYLRAIFTRNSFVMSHSASVRAAAGGAAVSALHAAAHGTRR